MKRLLAFGFILAMVSVAAIVLFVVMVRNHVEQVKLSGGTHGIEVSRGASLRSVLNSLAEEGVLERPEWVYYYARARNLSAIRTGNYRLPENGTALDLLTMLSEGRVLTESFVIPEGMNRWQIREILHQAGWVDRQIFDTLCDDTAFLKGENVPGPTCDGYLFPETYTFARGIAPKELFRTLFMAWKSNLERVRKRLGPGPLALDPRKFTTLASIVEKETGAVDERPRIACVFYNRLQSKPVMKLQTDPTVIYAATLADPGFDGNIKSYHLRKLDHPYNTYLRFGLPPGPIAAPGKAAFEAVARPAECNDLFFVSMNNGRHVFCPTYECHLDNVQKWQVQYFRRQR